MAKTTGIFVAAACVFSLIGIAAAADAVSQDQAAKQALATVPNGKVAHSGVKRDDGVNFYRVIVIDDAFKYSFEIDPRTGVVERQDKNPINKSRGGMTPEMQMAKDKALLETGGGNVVEIDTDTEDGVPVIEVDIYDEQYRYEVTVEAATGNVLELKKKRFK